MTEMIIETNVQLSHAVKIVVGVVVVSREFNELPHIFEQRISTSMAPAASYLNCFSSPALTALARVFMYVSGAVVAALLLCSLLGEGILLYVRVRTELLIKYNWFSFTYLVLGLICRQSPTNKFYCCSDIEVSMLLLRF